MTMKYLLLLTWSYIMFIQYTKQHTCNHYTIFISWRQVNVQCMKKKKMVTVLHYNEGRKPWLMGPNLYCKINCCQNRVQGTSNSATFRYNTIFHNAMLGLMFVSDKDNEINEINKINKHTYTYRYMQNMHIYMYIYIYIYIYSHGGQGQENVFVLMSVITTSNPTQNSAVIIDEYVFWVILWSKWDWFWIR